MRQILERLDDAVKSNLDERSISYLLQVFFLAAEKRHIAHEKEIEKLVDPLTQAKLGTSLHLSHSFSLTYPSPCSNHGLRTIIGEPHDGANVWPFWYGVVGIVH